MLYDDFLILNYVKIIVSLMTYIFSIYTYNIFNVYPLTYIFPNSEQNESLQIKKSK